ELQEPIPVGDEVDLARVVLDDGREGAEGAQGRRGLKAWLRKVRIARFAKHADRRRRSAALVEGSEPRSVVVAEEIGSGECGERAASVHDAADDRAVVAEGTRAAPIGDEDGWRQDASRALRALGRGARGVRFESCPAEVEPARGSRSEVELFV